MDGHATGSGVYRCIWVGTSGAVASLYGGILRTATHSGRGFTVTGFNIQAGSVEWGLHPHHWLCSHRHRLHRNQPHHPRADHEPCGEPAACRHEQRQGDDTTTAFAVTPSGTTPTLTALYKTDWQGKLKLYPTPSQPTPSGRSRSRTGARSAGTITQNRATAPDGTRDDGPPEGGRHDWGP